MNENVRAILLVAGRELRESARRRSFWVTLVLVLIGSTALAVVPEIFGGPDEATIATTGDRPPGYDQSVSAAAVAAGLRLRSTEPGDRAALDAAVRDEEADVGLDLTTDPPTVVAGAATDEAVQAVAQQVAARGALVEQLADRGVPVEQTAAALAGARPASAVLEPEQAGGSRTVAFVASLALYLLLLLLTTSVASGVAIEKSKRISEVLLAIVKPTALLYGKIIGVGLIGLVTLVVAVLPIAAKLALGGDVPAGTGRTLAAGAAWFVLGTALYLLLAGALGALVDRQEQVGSVMTPLSLVLVAGYLAGVTLSGTEVGSVLAVVPFTSPMVMPARLALGEAGPIEVVASLAALVLSVAIMARLATAVYARAIVRTGRRLRVRDVLHTA